MSHFNVSLTAWAKSRDSVDKPQFFFKEKRKESRSGSNRGPSAYQPSALPLGHTGSRTTLLSSQSPFIRSNFHRRTYITIELYERGNAWLRRSLRRWRPFTNNNRPEYSLTGSRTNQDPCSHRPHPIFILSLSDSASPPPAVRIKTTQVAEGEIRYIYT